MPPEPIRKGPPRWGALLGPCLQGLGLLGRDHFTFVRPASFEPRGPQGVDLFPEDVAQVEHPRLPAVPMAKA